MTRGTVTIELTTAEYWLVRAALYAYAEQAAELSHGPDGDAQWCSAWERIHNRANALCEEKFS